MSRSSTMRRFWDRRARENAYYFINNELSYADSELDEFWASGERDVERLLGDLGVELQSDQTALEIGCGIGRMTRPIAARAAGVIALDVSSEMIEGARQENQQLTNVEWMVGDGTSLAGVEDRSVDAIISYVVLQHIPDADVVLGYIREMGRVLRAGGWALFQVCNDERIQAQRPWHSRRALRNQLRALIGRAPRGQYHPAWLGSKVELSQVREAAARGGMAIERTVGEGTQYLLVLSRKSSDA